LPLSLFFSMLLTTLFALSSGATPRSLSERLDGIATTRASQELPLLLEFPPTQDARANSRGLYEFNMTLTTEENRRLKLEEKRSIVMINEANIEETGLDEELKNKIYEVVNNPSVVQGYYHSGPTGLNAFYVFGNYRARPFPQANPIWYLAIIPKNIRVEEVILQTEWFGTGAGAHSQVRMILNKPVIGIPQRDGEYTPIPFNAPEYGEKGEITYNLQAVRMVGGEQEWSPLGGIMGEFSVALGFYDTRSLALDQIKRSVIDDHLLLNLSEAAKKAVLVRALETSNDQGVEGGIYNTVFASCITFALNALKAAIPNIRTTWFNPYTYVRKVSEAHRGGTRATFSSMNDIYGPYFDNNDEIMTWEKIRTGESSRQAYAAVNRPGIRQLIRTDALEEVVQRLSILLNQQGWKYSQVKEFMALINESGLSIQEATNSLAAGNKEDVAAFLQQLRSTWQASSLSSEHTLDEFFQALRGLQSQNTEEPN
jgi:hypothetical protein